MVVGAADRGSGSDRRRSEQPQKHVWRAEVVLLTADRHDGRGDQLDSAEREELRRLRREVRQLRQEREILAKAAAWFARETGSIPSGSSSS